MDKYIVLAAIAMAWSYHVAAHITINIACSNFPPYYYVEDGACVRGRALDKIRQLNEKQKKYVFKLYVTSPARKTVDFQNRKFDMSLYSNINWGWDKSTVFVSCIFYTDHEVFIARKDQVADNSAYFDDIATKRIVAINGFHYAFAHFNADREYLLKNFSIELTNTHQGNIMAVLLRRADVAIVTKSFLDDWRREHPDLSPDLVESKKYDQTYQFTAVVRKDSMLTKPEIDTLLGCDQR
ncbi:transporter substrate-binding domain-containing protein [Chromobacterium amazonense]|uniref:transporter substrate-binding domain-containing protein n=1 Tax=Chromobacterium amazonense TaxID=1382803 RepID=UPI00237D468C|nr:transporter substrate-binding domain-containing protein [Chromobacterium amazonense]MDE1716227.1 transporter substrate-binding domain-containing protein [Chromobacterium amazonense]